MDVIAASPNPIIACQKSIAGTVTAIPPASEKTGEKPICSPQANAPNTTDKNDTMKMLREAEELKLSDISYVYNLAEKYVPQWFSIRPN